VLELDAETGRILSITAAALSRDTRGCESRERPFLFSRTFHVSDQDSFLRSCGGLGFHQPSIRSR